MLVATGQIPPGRSTRIGGSVLTIATAGTAVIAATTAQGGAATSVGRIYLATVARTLAGGFRALRDQGGMVARRDESGLGNDQNAIFGDTGGEA